MIIRTVLILRPSSPLYLIYSLRAEPGLSLAWLLAFTKLFASLASRVVGLFTRLATRTIS